MVGTFADTLSIGDYGPAMSALALPMDTATLWTVTETCSGTAKKTLESPQGSPTPVSGSHSGVWLVWKRRTTSQLEDTVPDTTSPHLVAALTSHRLSPPGGASSVLVA